MTRLPVVGIGGGGGIKHRVPVMVLATQFMTSTERESFMAALDPETRSELISWTANEAATLKELQDTLAPGLIGIRQKDAQDFLKYKIDTDPLKFKFDYESVIKDLQRLPGTVKPK